MTKIPKKEKNKMSNFCKVKFCIFKINNTRKMTINGISSKLIPRRLIPMFCGIKREIANTEPIVRELNLLNFLFSLTVGPAGLEPATDGL